MSVVRCNCGHIVEGVALVPADHDPVTGECRVCGCMRGDALPLPGEKLTFGQHRIRDIDATTAPAWSDRQPTLDQRRAAIDRVLRRPRRVS